MVPDWARAFGTFLKESRVVLIHTRIENHQKETTKIEYLRDFPGKSVVKTLPFNARGTGLIPDQGAKIPHASGPKNPQKTIKQKQCCNKLNKDFKNGPHQGDLQDGGGLRREDRLPPHKYIRNTSTRGTTPTEHLLNAGRRPQVSQKARNSPRTWVGQKKKQIQKNWDQTCTSGRVL